MNDGLGGFQVQSTCQRGTRKETAERGAGGRKVELRVGESRLEAGAGRAGRAGLGWIGLGASEKGGGGEGGKGSGGGRPERRRERAEIEATRSTQFFA